MKHNAKRANSHSFWLSLAYRTNIAFIKLECPRRRRILLVLPQVRCGILDGSTCPFGVLAVRGVYEPFLINAPRGVSRGTPTRIL